MVVLVIILNFTWRGIGKQQTPKSRKQVTRSKFGPICQERCTCMIGLVHRMWSRSLCWRHRLSPLTFNPCTHFSAQITWQNLIFHTADLRSQFSFVFPFVPYYLVFTPTLHETHADIHQSLQQRLSTGMQQKDGSHNTQPYERMYFHRIAMCNKHKENYLCQFARQHHYYLLV